MAKRLKEGAVVTITANKSDHRFKIGQRVRIRKVNSDDYMAETLNKSDWWWISDDDCKTNLKTKSMSKTQANPGMVQACLAAANELLKANNTVTTLEIKLKLRANEATEIYHWTQDIVSGIMADAEQQGLYTVAGDNGTYRTYSRVKKGPGRPRKVTVSVSHVGNTTVGTVRTTTQQPTKPQNTITKVAKEPKVKWEYITRREALELMRNNRGHFFTATFFKKAKDGKPGEERVMNCQFLKDQGDTSLGYVKVKEASKMKAGEPAIRNVNLQTLKALYIAKRHCKIR